MGRKLLVQKIIRLLVAALMFLGMGSGGCRRYSAAEIEFRDAYVRVSNEINRAADGFRALHFTQDSLAGRVPQESEIRDFLASLPGLKKQVGSLNPRSVKERKAKALLFESVETLELAGKKSLVYAKTKKREDFYPVQDELQRFEKKIITADRLVFGIK